MVENYKTWVPVFVSILLFAVNPVLLCAQETKVFTTEDFDLIGKVKSCLVLTDYGREEFDFNKEGMLTKSVTRYSDKDYSITYYKFKDGFLAERRDEVYRDGNFDENSSIAHFFERDSTSGITVTEQIVSYSKEFIDSYKYFFDEDSRLVKTIRSGTDGVDETRVEYSQYKGETTITYFLNEVLQKTIRESEQKGKDGKAQRILLTKEFINGAPDEAMEAIYNNENQLVSETFFEYDEKEKSFVPSKKIGYQYGEHGVHSAIKTQEGLQNSTDSFIYQFDTTGNWIKQIVTPSNSYTTRKISYYQAEKAEADKSGN